MNIQQITTRQLEQDRAVGFPAQFSSENEKYEQIRKDLIGLFGEIGEFSNVVKKITIKLDRPEEYKFDVAESQSALREELADAFIYILRIATLLGIDLEAATLEKMEFNRVRYAGLKR